MQAVVFIQNCCSDRSPAVAATDISWLWSLKDYWFAIIGALMGTLIGIGWTRWKDEQKRRNLAVNYHERLKSCIAFNLERLRQAKAQLATNAVPNYPFDTAQLNHWLAQSHDLLPADLLRSIDWQRFQLDHLSSKFIVINNAIVIKAGQRITPEEVEHRKALVASLDEHVNRVLSDLSLLFEKVNGGVSIKP